MAVTVPITLNTVQVLLSQSQTAVGVTVSNNGGILIGVVEMVSDFSDGRYSVGDIVSFDSTKASVLTYSASNYYLTTEDNILYKEDSL